MIHKLTQTQLKRMIIFMTFIWSLFPTAVSLFNGGQSDKLLYYNDFIIFVVIYIIGAYLRLYPSGIFSSKKRSAGIALLSYVFIFAFMFVYDKFSDLLHPQTQMYFIKQNSVFIILLSIGVFCIFKDIKIKSSAFINTVASTTLGIYLLHDNKIGQTFLWKDLLDMGTYLTGPASVLCVFGFCAAIFVCGALIDLIRQIIEKYTLTALLNSRLYSSVKGKIRSIYFKILQKL